ncbi:hypothetical protein [Salipiger sp. PrR003]|uniref:hypothetical protein n=1 Tax=Salipiger sp. PrR003 TaxID=2706776 RepID=UPI0013DD162C|nr:hypothetical protein [Salipiger sp. PrR003]NDV49267.1 hypothetical protein [Salipiger sp. PrR003]
MVRLDSILLLGLALSLFPLTGGADAPGPDVSISPGEGQGPYLVGADGRPFYVMLTRTKGGDDLAPLQSCGPGCRTEWPPVIVNAPPQADQGVMLELLDTVNWRGNRVLRYSEQPLFRYERDKPGETPRGQGIFGYGGFWALVSPDGTPITSDAIPERAGDSADGK